MRLIAKNLVFCLIFGTFLFAADYRYARIEVPNGSQTYVRGINARGDILGSYTDAGGFGHDFLFHNGVFSNIVYPGGKFARARAINARGDIAGFLDDANGAHGFLLHDGKITRIDFPGADFTRALGINNTGDITGGYFAHGKRFGFMLRDGVFSTVPVPGEGPRVGVLDAEDNGRVVVGEVILKSDLSDHAFIKRRGDVQFIDPPGTIFACAFATGINEREDVAGWFAIVNTVDECNGGPPIHGFVLRQGAYDTIDPPGSVSTFVWGINDDGVVVGIYFDKKGNLHSFKATPKN